MKDFFIIITFLLMKRNNFQIDELVGLLYAQSKFWVEGEKVSYLV